ncbi:MAG: 23S rRNA (adenine(2503)-C(2))-methyltransferase RlmN [Chromatiaceae bacterium]|nr:23S rRNA (adenine(2503)-C(2))-methyltransferase RlmN [Chromatiaceae bacterium]MCP5314406.1 23S rRNA (adenine(2503)-C(2))-methyltransferase RlmN [Chromatiaceae bacterium]
MEVAASKTNLVGLGKEDMESFFTALDAKAFHGRNVLKWIHKHGVTSFDAMTDVPKALRERLAESAEIALPRIALAQPARDGTTKWLLELADGQFIETVYIPDAGRSTICVSSQVGCALDCAFCSTAQQGFNRNLSVAEIIGQVWIAARAIGHMPTNVVMMGMGEPLANFDNVVAAMALMQEDLAYMISKSRVTISTSGIVPALRRLREVSDVSLAVSLHAPDNALRDQLVPINRKYPLEELIPACRDFISGDRRRKVTWEYVMLDGVNDSIAHAKALIRLLQGVPSKVNLIPFNPFPGNTFRTSPPDRVEAFRQRLKRAGIMSMTRKTRGDDIDAACGQLVGKVDDRSGRRLKRVPVALEQM